MNELGITRTGHLSSNAGKDRFWRRQFAARETLAQLVFDGTFGVFAPLLCVIFDPVVFRGGLFGGPPMFEGLRVFAYAIIFVEIAALLAWQFSARTPTSARILGGVMLAGALFSFGLGVVLFPFSLIGIAFYGIGLCGFTPLLTAFIYLRNGRRALRHAQTHALPPGRQITPMLLSAVLTLALAGAAQWQVTRTVTHALRVLTEGDAAAAPAATRQLGYMHRLTGADVNELVWAYRRDEDAARRARLAVAYQQITGETIEARLELLRLSD